MNDRIVLASEEAKVEVEPTIVVAAHVIGQQEEGMGARTSRGPSRTAPLKRFKDGHVSFSSSSDDIMVGRRRASGPSRSCIIVGINMSILVAIGIIAGILHVFLNNEGMQVDSSEEPSTLASSPPSGSSFPSTNPTSSPTSHPSLRPTLSPTFCPTPEWIPIGEGIVGELGAFDSWSISLSEDGTTLTSIPYTLSLAIGAWAGGAANLADYVHVHLFDGTSWTQIGSTLSGGAEMDASGWSVSLSADGNTLAIGAYSHDSLNWPIGEQAMLGMLEFSGGTNFLMIGNNWEMTLKAQQLLT